MSNRSKMFQLNNMIFDGQSDQKNNMNKIQLVEKIESKAYRYINFENLDHYIDKKGVKLNAYWYFNFDI